MQPEIVALIGKLKKEIYQDLVKKKEIMPKGYFIIESPKGISEIMVPGLEVFITSPEMKNELHGYVRYKWEQYNAKGRYNLLAFVLVSDSYVVDKMIDERITDEEARSIAKSLGPASRHKDRQDCIIFSVHTAQEHLAYYYIYRKEGNRVLWGNSREEKAIDEYSTFFDLFPGAKEKENI